MKKEHKAEKPLSKEKPHDKKDMMKHAEKNPKMHKGK